MFGKKVEDEEPKIIKTKKVYDFDSDKSKGMLKDYMSASKVGPTKKDEKQFAIPKVNDIDFENIKNNSNDAYIDEYEDDTEEDGIDLKYKVKITLLVLFLFTLILGLCLAIWAANSNVFMLKKIVVKDGIYVTSGDIIPLMSGDRGKNIFVISTSSVKKRVESLPHVKNAKVKRVLLDTIEISFDERIPKMLFSNEDSNYVLDQYGFILSNDWEVYGVMPIINFTISKKYKVGDTLEGTDLIKYKNLLYILEVANNIGFDYNISRIWYENVEDIKLYIEDAEIFVLYGPLKKDQTEDKLLYLREVVRKSKEQGLKGYLNMSSDDYHKSVLNSKT